MLIVSEQQAHAVGLKRAGPKRYKVWWYIQPQTRLTLFMVEVTGTKEIITRE